MNTPLVSVRCTTFNHEKYIRQALDSFLMQQTDFPFEIVVHDDASTDGTQEILKEYAQKNPEKIRLILQTENQYSQGRGPSGFLHPQLRGRYVAFCEGDDYWTDPEKLQLQVDYLESHPECSLCAHQAIRVNEAGDYVRPYCDDPNQEDYDMDFEAVLHNLSRFPTASMLFRTAFFREKKDSLDRFWNFDYLNKLLLAGSGRVRVLARPMAAYRMASQGSWTERMQKDNRKYIQHLQNAARTYEAVNEYFEGRYQDLMEPEIRRRWAQVYECSGNLPALKQPEMRPYYDKLSASSKLSLHLRQYCPWVYRLLKKED